MRKSSLGACGNFDASPKPVAQQLNTHFVAIKVDRDERPDVDRAYQRALIASGTDAGWPSTLLLLPDGRAFVARTYLGRDELLGLLEAASVTWRSRRSLIQPIDRKIGRSRRTASSRVLAFHRRHRTGLSACLRRYGLLASCNGERQCPSCAAAGTPPASSTVRSARRRTRFTTSRGRKCLPGTPLSVRSLPAPEGARRAHESATARQSATAATRRSADPSRTPRAAVR